MISPYVIPGLRNMSKVSNKLQDIVKIVSDECDVPEASIASYDKHMNVCFARHVFCYIAKAYSGKSLKQIGDFLNRDHTTIINSLEKVARWRQTNPSYNRAIKRIEMRL